jgi:hypothetical protein
MSYLSLVPVGTVEKEIWGELRKGKERKEERKEKRKEGSEIRAIDRIVRSFEIGTKPSTHSNDQFGIYLSLLFSI